VTGPVSESDQSAVETPEPGSIRALLARNGWAMGGIAVVTILVEAGTYAAGRVIGIGPLSSALAALAGATVWTALVAPVAAAGGRDWLDALLRGGVVADASAVVLLALWLIARNGQTGEPYVTFLAAVKIYCTLAAMALLSVAVVTCGRSVAGRHILAVALTVVFVLLLTSLLWAGVPMAMVDGPAARARVAGAALWVNPFCSVTAATIAETNFTWYRYGWMYNHTPVVNYPKADPPWYAATLSCLCAAGIALCAGYLRRQGRRGVE